MGKIIRLNGVSLTDAVAPKIIERDHIEIEGSLFLFDGNHEFDIFSGVPALNAKIPNILWRKAAAAIGSPGLDRSSLDASVVTRAGNSSTWLVERTLRGGLHGIITQAGTQSGGLAYVMALPSALRDYIFNNRLSRSFYTSIWTKTTRIGLSSTAPQSPFHFSNVSNGNVNYLFHYQGGRGRPASTSRLGGRDDPLTDDHSGAAPFNRFASVAVNGINGSGPSIENNVEIGLGNFGSWGSANVNKCPSRIIYRAYIEDLTTSGRTYAQVDAIDYALWQAAFAAGGKFHGDTYTDPATLP